MKKQKLVAVLLAVAPLLSHADVTVYGSIRGGLNVYKNAQTNQTTTGVDDYSSRIGFKGNEDLGNGLKAIWQVESGLAIDGTGSATGTSSGTFANRMSFVGLQGDFGKIRLGYLDDVTTETEATDIWYDSRQVNLAFPIYDNGVDLIGNFGDSRIKNSVRYDTPNLAGFSGILQYGADETSTAGKPKQTQLGARLAYTNSGFFGAYAYQAKQNQGANNDKTSAINRIEAGYDANNLYLAATYNWLTGYGNGTKFGINDANAELKSQSWALTAAYQFGAFKPKLTYSQYKDPKVDGVSQDWGVKQVAVGLDYSLSKRTLIGVQYAQMTFDQGYQTVTKSAGDKSSVFGTYMKHNF
ncbi:porin [Neisseriaceae bacterium JH1-16]|nr:porin [Neisseriaceae bacterium JH1-16]